MTTFYHSRWKLTGAALQIVTENGRQCLVDTETYYIALSKADN